MNKARLRGEPLVLPHDDVTIIDTIKEISKDANLIMIGLPDSKRESKENRNLFRQLTYSFSKEVEVFDNLPPILFVKASRSVDLIEE